MIGALSVIITTVESLTQIQIKELGVTRQIQMYDGSFAIKILQVRVHLHLLYNKYWFCFRDCTILNVNVVYYVNSITRRFADASSELSTFYHGLDEPCDK